jgi:serine/threonine protein kinase
MDDFCAVNMEDEEARRGLQASLRDESLVRTRPFPRVREPSDSCAPCAEVGPPGTLDGEMGSASDGNRPVLLAPGQLFHGRYRVEACVGHGAMGHVYEALDERTNGRRALKVMPPSLANRPDLLARFEREATVANPIGSEHIVKVLDAGIDPETRAPFLAMEMLDGEDLGQLLDSGRFFEPAEVVTLLSQAALALQKTQAAGLVHRDLKPANMVMSRRDDGSAHLTIIDFGIAKIVADSAVGTRRRG